MQWKQGLIYGGLWVQTPKVNASLLEKPKTVGKYDYIQCKGSKISSDCAPEWKEKNLRKGNAVKGKARKSLQGKGIKRNARKGLPASANMKRIVIICLPVCLPVSGNSWRITTSAPFSKFLLHKTVFLRRALIDFLDQNVWPATNHSFSEILFAGASRMSARLKIIDPTWVICRKQNKLFIVNIEQT